MIHMKLVLQRPRCCVVLYIYMNMYLFLRVKHNTFLIISHQLFFFNDKDIIFSYDLLNVMLFGQSFHFLT